VKGSARWPRSPCKRFTPTANLRRWTLSERTVAAENLDSDDYVARLLERLSWATADTKAVESRSADLAADRNEHARQARLTVGSRGEDASRRSGSRPIAGDRRTGNGMRPERPGAVPSVPERAGAHALPQEATRTDGGDRDDFADAAWLYAWSHEALRPVGESMAARVIAEG